MLYPFFEKIFDHMCGQLFEFIRLDCLCIFILYCFCRCLVMSSSLEAPWRSPRKSVEIVETEKVVVNIPKCDLITSSQSEDVRRSIRDPSVALLEKTDFKSLIDKVTSNDQVSIVLKLKNHVISDINNVVLDAIIDALRKNTVCQVAMGWIFDYLCIYLPLRHYMFKIYLELLETVNYAI